MSRTELLTICASIIFGASLELDESYHYTPQMAVEAAKKILDTVDGVVEGITNVKGA